MTTGEGFTLYNTLTRRKERFEPLDPNNVRMYVCGPTVYDFAHIGNARPVIVFDIVFRLLRHLYGAEHVTYVRNITDVDDKINARARQEYPDLPLNEAIQRVTEKTARQFHEDVAALGCLPPTHEPRATEFVLARADGRVDMAGMIRELIRRGHAYIAHGPEGREVLFDVSTMPDYGELSKRRLEEQKAGARIKVEPHKRNPEDFVLWKESREGEPGWKASFGTGDEAELIYGRPGWHIECSAMSAAYLGTEFDIHGGGIDLIFPHHENEIAQSRCAYGTPMMAKYWMHNGFLQVEGRKMAKSEGNFITIRELLREQSFGGRSWPGEVLRLAMLMTHYREPIDFSVRRLEEAESTLESWRRAMAAAGIVWREEDRQRWTGLSPDADVVAALCNDLNSGELLAALHALANRGEAGAARSLFASLDFLGLGDFDRMRQWQEDAVAALARAGLDPAGIERRIAERLELIRRKDYAAADRIRDEMLAAGIQIKDSKDPRTGERVSSWELRR